MGCCQASNKKNQQSQYLSTFKIDSDISESFNSDDNLIQDEVIQIKNIDSIHKKSRKKLKTNYMQIPNRMNLDRKSVLVQYGINGIINSNNTCFISSALQCILRIMPLKDYFDNNIHKNDMRKNLTNFEKEFLNQTAFLFSSYHNNNYKMIDIDKFIQLVPKIFCGYEIGNQEDAQEFLSMFFDKLNTLLNRVDQNKYINNRDIDKKIKKCQKENLDLSKEQTSIQQNKQEDKKINLLEESQKAWNNYLQENKSIIVDIFQGQISVKLQCQNCQQQKLTFDPLMYLSIPVKTYKEKPLNNLQECLQQNFLKEILNNDNKLYCEKCESKNLFEKQNKITKPPNILIIHLNRFNFDNYEINKNDVFIEYPVNNLNIQQFCFNQKQTEYKLFAVCCHQGSVDYGHYYSYATNNVNQWFLFDDEYVKKVDVDKVVSEQAYLLFYIKKNLQNFKRQTLAQIFQLIINLNSIKYYQSNLIVKKFQRNGTFLMPDQRCKILSFLRKNQNLLFQVLIKIF